MLRVCGATKARSTHDQRKCWCRGQFCGLGGGRLSDRFFADFHTRKTARTLGEFMDLVQQPDLFDGDTKRKWWEERLFTPALLHPTKPRKPRAAARTPDTQTAPAAAAPQRPRAPLKFPPIAQGIHE